MQYVASIYTAYAATATAALLIPARLVDTGLAHAGKLAYRVFHHGTLQLLPE